MRNERKTSSARKTYPKKTKSPIRAIRLFCFECMGWDRREKDPPRPYEEVKNCPDKDCPLYDFRLGRNPFISRKRGEMHPNARKALQRYRDEHGECGL